MFFVAPLFPVVEASPKTWTFYDSSMYVDYKVTVRSEYVWEVGRKYTVSVKIEVTDSTNEGYLFINSIEIGPVLSTKKDVVSVTLYVGESYTHEISFLVIESEYGIYEAMDYSESLCVDLGGQSYYRDWKGEMDSFGLYFYETCDIIIRGIEPYLWAEFSSREVIQGTPIDLDITVRYPSGRGIEGCMVQVMVDSETYVCNYQGAGVYSCTIQTEDLSLREHEIQITISKSLYYLINFVESVQPVKGYTIEINAKPIPLETIGIGIGVLAIIAVAAIFFYKKQKGKTPATPPPSSTA